MSDRGKSNVCSFLWKKYFRDPSQWYDYRTTKVSSRVPDFKHKLTDESLWIYDSSNPSWVAEELRRRGFFTPSLELRHKDTNQEKNECTEFVNLLKVCAKKKNLEEGARLHALILKRGLIENSSYVRSTLVNMYAKCGAFEKAEQVLDELPLRDVVSWTALIAGYVNDGQGKQALSCFERMRGEGVNPNVVTFICTLKACASTGSLDKGIEIHDEILNKGLFGKDVMLGTALVDMYAKCGEMEKAEKVFDELPVCDVATWTALISGCCQHGRGDDALKIFKRMKDDGVDPNAVTFLCLLKACGSTKSLDMGKQIHKDLVVNGLLKTNIKLGNALVDMYGKCGAMSKAHEVFNQFTIRDVASWNVLITGYAQQGFGEEALNCFEQMKHDTIPPNEITFIAVLKACGSICDVVMGRQVHEEIVNRGLIEKDIVVVTALIDMYAKCGELMKAEQVLYELPVRDVISWTSLISGHVQHGKVEEAFSCFAQMQREGFCPNVITFICMLKASGIARAIDKGKQIHYEITNKGLLLKDVILGNALVDMYAKCGALAKAEKVLNELPVRDTVSWNVLITGYAQKGQGENALTCFNQMQKEGISPDAVTLLCMLKACGSTGAIDKGEVIHEEIKNKGLLGKDILLGNALVDMYAKCGELQKAREVLEELPLREATSWTALIAGYAQQGQGREALNCFKQMQSDGVSPDLITFLCVLNACSHTGLVDEGERYFTDINEKYGLAPGLDHHSCMVDLYGRAGHFEKAIAVIEKLPSSDYLPIWTALLGACQKWGNIKLARFAFEQAVQLDVNNTATYVLMSNIYIAAGMQDEAAKIDAMREKHATKKEPGHSLWVDSSGNVHLFYDKYSDHLQSRDIHEKLQEISLKMSEQGYPFNLHWVSKQLFSESKIDNLCEHNQIWAITCALINTSKAATVHVVKNRRMCSDCHLSTSIVSKIEQCKIIVRDTSCLHVFKNGMCSCQDHW